MKFFTYDRDNESLVLNVPEILLTKEFAKLLELGRNKTKNDKTGKNKERAYKEFTYMYLALDWESQYFNIPEQDRHEAALEDSELTEAEFSDPDFRSACRKYEELQNSNISIRLLKSAMKAVETVIFYLEHVDVSDKDEVTGKPIYKTKDLIIEIKGCKDLIVGIQELEKQVKKDIAPDNKLRGGAEAGFFD